MTVQDKLNWADCLHVIFSIVNLIITDIPLPKLGATITKAEPMATTFSAVLDPSSMDHGLV